MGVTLERVQNKFACIIGELSHDPDILSQFAIWVDLRIAEYKAKGAISLECTGDDPNPTWLRGHKKSFLKGKLPRMTVRCQTEPLNHPEPFNEQFTQEAEERLSPNIVVVKNEPGTDIFPVNVHANSSTVNAVSSSRKRPSSSSYSPEDSDHTSQLPLKLGKHSSSPAVLEPMNQSLMSIISKCESLDESGEMSDSTANPAQDSASVAGMGDNSMCMPSASTGSTENPDNSSPDIEEENENEASSHSSYVESPSLYAEDWIQPQSVLTDSRRHLYPSVYPERLTYRRIEERLQEKDKKSQLTRRHMVKIVATLERWLWGVHNENRNVENIPPSELNQYLTEFYGILQAPDGSEYNSSTLLVNRSRLSRFLIEIGYPVSIVRGEEFNQANEVYIRRRRLMEEQQRVKEYWAEKNENY